MAKNLADAGSYAVSWHCLVPPSPVVAVLVCGSGASGSLEAPAEADLFTFSGQAGAKVQVTLTRTAGFSGLARAQVFAPSGAVVHTFDSDGAPEIALSETGVHVIRVQARNLVDSGGYDLGFVCDSGT
jgi:hypothetical protein